MQLRSQEHFGGIDVLINNAGYGLMGAVGKKTVSRNRESSSETNLFRRMGDPAVIPLVSERGSGAYHQMSPASTRPGRPALYYPYMRNASKHAVEGINGSLAENYSRLESKNPDYGARWFSTRNLGIPQNGQQLNFCIR